MTAAGGKPKRGESASSEPVFVCCTGYAITVRTDEPKIYPERPTCFVRFRASKVRTECNAEVQDTNWANIEPESEVKKWA